MTDLGEVPDAYRDAPLGYAETLSDGTIVTANRTLLRWTDREGEAAKSKLRFQDLLSFGGKIYYETHFAPLLNMQGSVTEIAFDFLRSGKEPLPTLVNAVQKLDAAGKPRSIQFFVFSAVDRRRYEQELLHARRRADEASAELQQLTRLLEQRVAEEVAERMKAEEALRQAQKMEAIGQLTGGVAHDFNNLLTIVLGGLEAIGRYLPKLSPGPDVLRVRRAHDAALEGVHRAAALTQRLLAFARRQPLAPQSVDINALVAGTSEILRRTLGETVRLETVQAGGLWRSFVDPNQLENALLNLAVNARDAMPEGGKLTIETHNAHLDEAYVEELVEPVPAGQYVLVAVSDTGHGMDQATLAQVFEPFFTTKGVGKGTGLGLSQVYGFIRQSGGHVRIYSEPSLGTTVKLYLPRHHDKGVPVEKIERRQPSGELPRAISEEAVLVVEDEAALRSYSAESLRDLGYVVFEAEEAASALRILECHGEIRLLFTDVVLPGGMNGKKLAEAAMKSRPSLRVLYATGYTRNAIVHHGRLDPGVQLLSKPFSLADLAHKIRQVLDSD